MEVYELPITPEESKNYHSFFIIKGVDLREWIRFVYYGSNLCCRTLRRDIFYLGYAFYPFLV